MQEVIMSKKISIIIPVYNAMTSGGGYIGRCIESVINQKDFDINDIEMIVINDGSKDNSLKILKEYSAKYPQIRLIDQKNMGVANTRNKALELVEGEYTTYLDQDDWIDEDFCSVMYAVAKEADYDVVIGGYRRPDSKGVIRKKVHPRQESFFRYSIMAAWAKIHRTDFLRKNNIKFFVTDYGEDFPFTGMENTITQNYKIVDYTGYNWFMNDASVSNTSQKKLTDKNVESIIRLIDKLKSVKDASGFATGEYDYMVLRTGIYSILFSASSATKKEFLNATDRVFDIIRINFEELFNKNGKKIRYPKFPRGEQSIYKVAVTLFVLAYNCNLLWMVAAILCRHDDDQPSS